MRRRCRYIDRVGVNRALRDLHVSDTVLDAARFGGHMLRRTRTRLLRALEREERAA
ncbi:MAG: hypothetical protein FWD69_17955 [Polyangiaceae bacterium]|nr:hypothetical protein [Polyangiaceae bacterium]